MEEAKWEITQNALSYRQQFRGACKVPKHHSFSVITPVLKHFRCSVMIVEELKTVLSRNAWVYVCRLFCLFLVIHACFCVKGLSENIFYLDWGYNLYYSFLATSLHLTKWQAKWHTWTWHVSEKGVFVANINITRFKDLPPECYSSL